MFVRTVGDGEDKGGVSIGGTRMNRKVGVFVRVNVRVSMRVSVW